MSKAKKSDIESVLKFLTKENRPFSVQNIVDALQRAGVKKTAVERSLASLVESGQVNKKEYGKAKIFILAQDTLQLPNEQDVQETDTKLAQLSEQLQATQRRLQEKHEQINHLRPQLTLGQAKQKNQQLQSELKMKLEKRQKLGDASSLMSKDDKLQIDKDYMKMKSAWKKYSRLIKDIVDQVSEATGKKRKELYEEMSIETDEDVNINITDFPDISANNNNVNSKKRLSGSKLSASKSNNSSVVKRSRLS